MNDLKKSWIILVDDDEDDRFLVQQAFRNRSQKLVLQCLASGAELFELLEQSVHLPALLLLDLNMPFMNGFEVLSRIRSHRDYSRIPVIMLTTSDAQSDRQQAHELGANQFITKPSTLLEISSLVTRLEQEWFKED